MRLSSFVEKECRAAMVLNDTDISRIMDYAQQIEESKIREIRQVGKRPRSDDSSYQKTKKRFFHEESSMGSEDRDPNRNSQYGGHTFEWSRCASYGSNIWVSFMPEWMVSLGVVERATR